jgi:hypothetical protein
MMMLPNGGSHLTSKRCSTFQMKHMKNYFLTSSLSSEEIKRESRGLFYIEKIPTIDS